MKKIILILSIFLSSFIFAADIDHFIVEVKPNPIEVNQAGDLIVKAVDANGNIVDDYEGDAIITVLDSEGNDVSDNNSVVELPNDGVISFTADDGGEKIFSKGIIFKKAGNYTVKVSDITDDSIEGETTVQVNAKGGNNLKGTVKIQSPINGSIEKKLPIDIIATTNLPNTIYQIFIDGQKAKEGLTDENGSINDTIDELNKGEHTLQIKLVDGQGNVIGQSQSISFSYQPPEEKKDLFKSIQILPSNVVNQGDKITFVVNTDKSVKSAEILIKGLGSYPMDKQADGKFILEMTMDKPGTYEIGVRLNNGQIEKEYDKLAYLTVKELISIKNVKINIDEQKGTVDVTWDYTGKPAYFKVKWGENKDNLSKEKIVSENKIILTGLDFMNKNYYLQIVPLDESYKIAGQPSSIIKIDSGVHSAPNCMVKNIKLRLKKQQGKYYIVWDKVPGAQKYIISVADKPEGPFSKVGETTDTKWEYPFDPNAKKVVYKYYKVEAVCNDGQKVQIDQVKKVKVGPVHTMLMLILLSLILYSLYKLYSLTRE